MGKRSCEKGERGKKCQKQSNLSNNVNGVSKLITKSPQPQNQSHHSYRTRLQIMQNEKQGMNLMNTELTVTTACTVTLSNYNMNNSKGSYFDQSSTTINCDFSTTFANSTQQTQYNNTNCAIMEDTINPDYFEQFFKVGNNNQNNQRPRRLKIQKLQFQNNEDTQKLQDKFKNPQLQQKKITKKQLQKFQPQDFLSELEDIFKNLNESIKTYNYKIPSNPNYQKKASATQIFHPITFKKRILLIDNIIKLGVYFNYQRQIVQQAIALFDTLFLQPNNQIKEKNLQLYAITSLFISAKKEDSNKQTLDKYVEFTNQYTNQDFINCEMSILNLLKWQISPLSLETVNGVIIDLLEGKFFGCGYMKQNFAFQFRLNVLVDLINLKQNLTNFQYCIKNISLALIFVSLTIAQGCFSSLDQAQIDLTENIFHLCNQTTSSCNSTTLAKINDIFAQFMRKYFYLTSISDIALEIQYVAKFLDFLSDPIIYQVPKKIHIQAHFPNAVEFIQTSKFL
ncbi:amine-terminal domain cyclin (macronuclear) [Tetrahymena thermophila SB210]|uniref:Amine-terminal domain cyclin n=1 Tax=Tetrahymena thermophila (strain SB210) TaxID=312017 RepID=Q23TX1_TETTS|nr:amine-terminal domain cyclin [Tetrahymena thermophila SB210]EAS00010.2 amine-terminal domain cyclin [Tetrahymena thermophila SB210]|eukprot:XP_001020255.2 amine-terminal domain cyclin [Tetrahymena thermophila SB210]